MTDSDWQTIVNDIGPCLYRYFCGNFSHSQASDLVQESLIRLVKKHRNGEFDPAKGTIKSYAFGIARFVRMEARRYSPVIDHVEGENAVALQGEYRPDEPDQVSHLRWAISKLKPVEQEIILLIIDSDSSLDQIAAALSMPLGTVKSHVHRAKENLRHIMEVKNEP